MLETLVTLGALFVCGVVFTLVTARIMAANQKKLTEPHSNY